MVGILKEAGGKMLQSAVAEKMWVLKVKDESTSQIDGEEEGDIKEEEGQGKDSKIDCGAGAALR